VGNKHRICTEGRSGYHISNISSFHFKYSFLFLFFRFLGNQTNKTWELEKDEASGGNGGIEQDAEVSSGGSGQTVPPQALQSLRQAHLEVHGPRRARPVQHRRPRSIGPIKATEQE